MPKLRSLGLIFIFLLSSIPSLAGDTAEDLFQPAPQSRLPVFSISSPQEIFSMGETRVRGLAQAARGKAEQVQTKIDRDFSTIRESIPTPQVSTGISTHVDQMKLLMDRIGSDIQDFERLLK